jgi:transcriptional regulator of met regulon
LERRFPNRYAPKKGHGYTSEQVQEIIERMTDIVLDIVADETQRTALLERVETMMNAAVI